jgi:hypothetical protein
LACDGTTRVTAVMLATKKFDIDALHRAYSAD